MDLGSESSALECVEDKLVPASTTIEADKDQKTISLYKMSNSPVEASPPISKGFGLRKWRRIRRDFVNDDTTVNKKNSKVLKRVLSGATDPNTKHFPGSDVKQDSLGSVGSVNNMAGLAIAECCHGAGLTFSASMDSDNSSKSSKMGSKYLVGKSVISSDGSGQERKSRVDNSKKAKGEMIKIEKENSHSSMESSDSRSSNFVFIQAASYSLSSREPCGRRTMDYNEDDNDHHAHTSNRKDNVEGEEEEETKYYAQKSQIKNNGSSDNLDPLIEAFNSFHNLQEALKKELQKFQELGKEPTTSIQDGTESRSCINTGHEQATEAGSSRRYVSENMGEFGATCLDSKIHNLVNNVEHLEIKLGETKSIIKVKESEIRELESTISVSEPHNQETEIEIQDILQKKMEAEIEYLIFSRSVENLKRQIKVIREEKTLCEDQSHKMQSKLGEAETKAESLKNQAQDLQNHCVEITEIQEVKSFKKRVFRTILCLLVQLGLLFMLFSFWLMPESDIIVPT